MRASLYVSKTSEPRVLVWKSNLLDKNEFADHLPGRLVDPDNSSDIWHAQRARNLGLDVPVPEPIWSDGGYPAETLAPLLECHVPAGDSPFSAGWRGWVANPDAIKLVGKQPIYDDTNNRILGENDVVRYTDVNGQVRDLTLHTPTSSDTDLVGWLLSPHRKPIRVEGLADWAEAQGIDDLISWAKAQEETHAAARAAEQAARQAAELRRLKKRFNL